MAVEIERKFLVEGDQWRKGKRTRYRQGFLSTVKERTVRVRIKEGSGYLTIKGIAKGARRKEFEYEISLQDAEALLDLCEKPLIEKDRYELEMGGFTWEVDEFFGENQGLIVAELELENEDQDFPRPDWLGPEVTGDPRYFNSNLIKNPFSKW
jgi:CYTH domain-containing protein